MGREGGMGREGVVREMWSSKKNNFVPYVHASVSGFEVKL